MNAISSSEALPSPKSLACLFKTFSTISVPRIQRDYAQGRAGEESVREDFLAALLRTLFGERPSLNLDFIYGVTSEAGNGQKPVFHPIDGQQRLTTLFLLHWYVAAREGAPDAFKDRFLQGGSFSYSVRPTSEAFFNKLVSSLGDAGPGMEAAFAANPEAWVKAQKWFRLSWLHDPTVKSAVAMLKAIHEAVEAKKKSADIPIPTGTFERLIGPNPCITFHYVPMEEVGLSDDLYIKMNARGLPLTPFEAFKARYVEYLKNPKNQKQVGHTADEIAQKLDTTWSNFIWRLCYRTEEGNADNKVNTHAFDTAYLRLIACVALVTLPDESKQTADKWKLLRTGTPTFGEILWAHGGDLSPTFTHTLIALLDAWTKKPPETESLPLLAEATYFDEKGFWDKLASTDDRIFSFPNLLIIAGYAGYLRLHGSNLDPKQFQEWMRVVRNLAVNAEVTVDNIFNCLRGLNKLLEHSADILDRLAEGSHDQPSEKDLPKNEKLPQWFAFQLSEEHIKAALLKADQNWRDLLIQAEEHGYFKGQIGFLLTFSGIVQEDKKCPLSSWSPETHAQLADQFEFYLERAKEMFDEEGLRKNGFLWERALLAMGDYLLHHSGNRWSFLTNPRDGHTSWKRFLRGAEHHEKRSFLKDLWCRMREQTLEEIVSDTASLPAWRLVLCKNKEAVAYCENRLIYRHDQGDEKKVFLLKGMTRTTYAELLTFHLMTVEQLEVERDRFAPLHFERHWPWGGHEDQPHLRFFFTLEDRKATFQLYHQYGADSGFSLWVKEENLETSVSDHLLNHGFNREKHGNTDWLVRKQAEKSVPGDYRFLYEWADDLKHLQSSATPLPAPELIVSPPSPS